jgi:hypothetical protein
MRVQVGLDRVADNAADVSSAAWPSMMTTSRAPPRAMRIRDTGAIFSTVGELVLVANSSQSWYQRKDKGMSHGRSGPRVATQASISNSSGLRVCGRG